MPVLPCSAVFGVGERAELGSVLQIWRKKSEIRHHEAVVHQRTIPDAPPLSLKKEEPITSKFSQRENFEMCSSLFCTAEFRSPYPPALFFLQVLLRTSKITSSKDLILCYFLRFSRPQVNNTCNNSGGTEQVISFG